MQISRSLEAAKARLAGPTTRGQQVECPKCGDSGIHSWGVKRDGQPTEWHFNQPCPFCESGKAAAARIDQERIDALFKRSGLSERHRDVTMQSVNQSAETIKRACDAMDARHSLFLTGEPGTGKTWLAVALLRRELDRNIAGLFVDTPELFASIRRAYANKDGSAEAMIDAACSAPVLVLDDLGTEKTTDWVLDTLYRIVNRRDGDMLPTVVTTNYTINQLSARTNHKIVSRLMQGATVILIEHDDRRMSKKQTRV